MQLKSEMITESIRRIEETRNIHMNVYIYSNFMYSLCACVEFYKSDELDDS